MGRPRRRARAGPEKTIRVRIFLQGEFSKSLHQELKRSELTQYRHVFGSAVI